MHHRREDTIDNEHAWKKGKRGVQCSQCVDLEKGDGCLSTPPITRFGEIIHGVSYTKLMCRHLSHLFLLGKKVLWSEALGEGVFLLT